MVLRTMRHSEVTWKVIADREKKRCEDRALKGRR